MRRTPALPFEVMMMIKGLITRLISKTKKLTSSPNLQAFKFTGAKQTLATDADPNAATIPPQIHITAKSPALWASPSKPTNPPSSSSQPNIQKTNIKDPQAPIGGVPTELLGNFPLKCIIIGHNPSEIAWQRGHYYANPTNWMWRILKDTNLAPEDIISGCTEDFKMPSLVGVGFTDVGSGTPGTDSNRFKSKHFDEWRQPFYDRLAAHMKRASYNVESCTCGTCGAPCIVAFSGKKQFSELFRGGGGASFSGGTRKRKTGAIESSISNDTSKEKSAAALEPMIIRTQAAKPASISLGRQSILPLGWPLSLEKTEVWVMTSTSGAAAMSKEARYEVWKALADRLEHEPWPLNRKAVCALSPIDGGS